MTIEVVSTNLPKKFEFVRGADFAQFVKANGDAHQSRIGTTYEILNASLKTDAHEFLWRPKMAVRLGMLEALQFMTGYFDPNHIHYVVPNLAYHYDIANAYGQKVSQQLPKVLAQLRQFPETRRAILHIGKPEDGQEMEKPCMQSLQFQIRKAHLHATVFARSWDAIHGAPYDIILFNSVTQIFARLLGLQAGSVTVNASSLHVYERAFATMKTGTGEEGQKALLVSSPVTSLDAVREWAHTQMQEIESWSPYPEGFEVLG